MEALATTMILILITALIIDAVLREEDVQRWRAASRETRGKLNELNVGEMTTAANQWFRDLFDAVYGARFWSGKRMLRSFISSIFALVCFTLVIGWEGTIFGEPDVVDNVIGQIFVLLVIFFCNLMGDYLSLQETRWVMDRSQGSKAPTLVLWLIFDLAATTALFVFAAYVLLVLILLLISDFSLSGLIEFAEELPETMAAKDLGLPFWVSTYFTSALWLLFVGVVLTIRILKKISPALSVLLRTIGESDRPARAMAGFVCALLIVGYAALYLVMTTWDWIT